MSQCREVRGIQRNVLERLGDRRMVCRMSREAVQREQHSHPEAASHDGRAERGWFVGRLGSRTGSWVGWGRLSQLCRALSMLTHWEAILQVVKGQESQQGILWLRADTLLCGHCI